MLQSFARRLLLRPRLSPLSLLHARTVCHFSAFTENTFHLTADTTLNNIQDALDVLDDDNEHLNVDSTYASGVLTIGLGAAGTWVINKQTPNKQVWYSSPISGPARFEWEAGKAEWIHTRDAKPLATLFEDEIEQAVGVRADIDWDVAE